MPITLLSIGQVARRSGVAASALRFYESQGLIWSTRLPGKQRRFSADMLRRIAFIAAAQRVGLSLANIRDALATLPANRTPTKADWEALSRSWRPLLDARIDELQRLRSVRRPGREAAGSPSSVTNVDPKNPMNVRWG